MTILIAVLAGFVGGLLGAMIIYEAKNEDKDKSINALVDGHLSIKTALAKTDERISLIDKSNRIIANEQKRDRIQIWQSLNSLWNEMDKISAGRATMTATDILELSKVAGLPPQNIRVKPKS